MTEQKYSVDQLMEAVGAVQDSVFLRNDTVTTNEHSVTLSWTADPDGGIRREITLHTDGTPIDCIAWIPEAEATESGVYLGIFNSSNDGIYQTSREVHIESEGMLNDIAVEAAISTKNLP